MQARKGKQAVVVGGGPAGLMAAERLLASGLQVDLYEAKGSVGRKFLIAGKGGLNLTHAEPFDAFVSRFRERAPPLARWLRDFGADQLRQWARELGVETVVGSSGRVFPSDFKAAPLLRGWLRRLRACGLRIHVQHRCLGWTDKDELRFDTGEGETRRRADVTVLALGGGSWSKLGSDGAWVAWLGAAGADIAPLRPANCGFEARWSPHFAQRHAGAPLKPLVLSFRDRDGHEHARRGELIITAHGIEGSLAYALSAELRESLATNGPLTVRLDLAPDRSEATLTEALTTPRGKRTLGEHLRRRTGLDGVRAALLRECGGELAREPAALARLIKALPLVLQGTRPIDEAISSAGGVRLEAFDEGLMLLSRPGVFCCGEMLDWEAPTGGYLLTACFASGRLAGDAAARWLADRPGA